MNYIKFIILWIDGDTIYVRNYEEGDIMLLKSELPDKDYKAGDIITLDYDQYDKIFLGK
jgi:hypothetical protein